MRTPDLLQGTNDMRTMQRLLTYTTIMLLLLYPTQAKATELEHFGSAALATNVCYGIYKGMLQMPKNKAFWFGLACGTMVNITAEYLDAKFDSKDVIAGQLGVFTSGFVIKVFDF